MKGWPLPLLSSSLVTFYSGVIVVLVAVIAVNIIIVLSALQSIRIGTCAGPDGWSGKWTGREFSCRCDVFEVKRWSDNLYQLGFCLPAVAGTRTHVSLIDCQRLITTSDEEVEEDGTVKEQNNYVSNDWSELNLWRQSRISLDWTGLFLHSLQVKVNKLPLLL